MHKNPARSPPLSGGMWAQVSMFQLTSQARMHPSPSSFQRDVGQLILTQWEELETDKHEGGPKEWEAHAVCLKNELQ